jgi:hypothetical protein
MEKPLFFANSTFFMLVSVKKSLFFTLELLFFTLNYFFSRWKLQREKKVIPA